MPRGKKHTAEQIIGKLREAELAISYLRSSTNTHENAWRLMCPGS